ncbi:MAG: YkgJ family cysteine cluster protein [Candidatus Kapabacteria bacterium]|nr:YkgJ family cysteine cluster protein [Candidatus Kapabacteria bacterium]
MDEAIECRPHCGACCIAPSITTPLPNMPHGKPAGVPCLHLTVDLRCGLFGQATRPSFCASLQPRRSMCGHSAAEAHSILLELEILTSPKNDSIPLPP